MGRGERPIKPRDSWFSPKCIWVQRPVFPGGGRATGWLMGPTGLLASAELRMPSGGERGSETAGDKLRGREGNSPDRRQRSQNNAQCEMRCVCTDSQEVGSEAAIP